MRQRQIEQSNGTLTLNTQGPRKGPTILFLHDGGEARAQWSPLFAQLRPKHWQLVAPDLRDHVPDGRDYQLEDFLADGYQIIKHLKARPLVLVGSGLGGLMALMLTRRFPLMVDGLVFLNAPGQQPRTLQAQDVQSAMRGVPVHDPMGVRSRLLHDLMSDPELVSQAARSVSVPTLLLQGIDNPSAGDALLGQLSRDIPHLETIDIQAGQRVAIDNPEAVASEICDFVPGLIPDIIH